MTWPREMPEKLREMQVRFYAEAAKFNVLPIQTRPPPSASAKASGPT